MQFLQELMAGNREAMNNMVASNQQIIAHDQNLKHGGYAGDREAHGVQR